MTVTDLILNFRAALLAILPMVEKVNIPWRHPDAYDDWDDLVSCIYKQLVESVLSSSSDPEEYVPVSLNEYDLKISDYGQHATIDVENSLLGAGRWIFHALGTDKKPFDIVEVRELSPDGTPCSDELRECPVVGSRFSLTLPDGSSIHVLPGL